MYSAAHQDRKNNTQFVLHLPPFCCFRQGEQELDKWFSFYAHRLCCWALLGCLHALPPTFLPAWVNMTTCPCLSLCVLLFYTTTTSTTTHTLLLTPTTTTTPPPPPTSLPTTLSLLPLPPPPPLCPSTLPLTSLKLNNGVLLYLVVVVGHG